MIQSPSSALYNIYIDPHLIVDNSQSESSQSPRATVIRHVLKFLADRLGIEIIIKIESYFRMLLITELKETNARHILANVHR